MPTRSIIVAGAGGQGVLMAGRTLAVAGMKEGRDVTWFPSYGAEMRGGTANCTVVISDTHIGSPIVTLADMLIVMNHASLMSFEGRLVPGGFLVLDSSNIKTSPQRGDIDVLSVPVEELFGSGLPRRSANLVLAGALAGYTECINIKAAEEAVKYLGLANEAIEALNIGRRYGAHKKSPDS